MSVFGDSKKITICLTTLTKPKENGGECAILIHNMALYTPTKDETDRLKIKEIMTKKLRWYRFMVQLL